MTYGIVVRGTNGAFLASSETRNYELKQYISSGSRSGNVTTYTFTSLEDPMVFIALPAGGSGGIIELTQTSVKVLGNGNYAIYVYGKISGTPTGFGILANDSAGNLAFKASNNYMNVTDFATISSASGSVYYLNGSAIMFNCLASYTTKSVSYEWVEWDWWVESRYESIYDCIYEYTCQQEWVVSSTLQYVCTPTSNFVCGTDWLTGAFSCWYETGQSCGYQMVDTSGYQNVCANRMVCGFRWYYVNYVTIVWAKVERTDWAIYREVIRHDSGTQYTTEYLNHKSGFYKTIIGFDSITTAGTTGAAVGTPQGTGYTGTLPAGYIYVPPMLDYNSLYVGYEGYYTNVNTFPYSNGDTYAISSTALLR